MKKFITAVQIIVVLAVAASLAWGTDQIIQATEKLVGANHPTLPDTINRGFLINHKADGTHQDNVITPANLESTSGTAGASTYYRGDGTWGTPAGTGTITGATSNRGLLTTGTTLGLIETCDTNYILKWNGSAWVCAADAGTPSETNPSFDNILTGANTTATMTVGTGASIVPSGSGAITATALSAQYVDWSQASGATSVANRPTINGVTVTGAVLDTPANYPTLNQNTTGYSGGLFFGSDARGDIAIRGATAYGRLAIGSSGKIFTTDGTDPSWSAYTLAAPGAVGAVLYSDGTNWTRNSAPVISAANMTSFPTLNQNTTGTASNLSGTPALPNGTTATTQSQADGTTKIATTAYVDTGIATKSPLAGSSSIVTVGTITSGAWNGTDVPVTAGGTGASTAADALTNLGAAPLASPTFTGTVTIPTPFTLGAVSVTPTGDELNFVGGVTSAIQDQLDAKAPLISPSLTTPSLGAATADTLDTGQGTNKLYAMDQNVQTTDNVTFNTVSANEYISTCSPADNDCYVESVNVGDLAADQQAAGRLWFDNTANGVKVVANDNASTLDVWTSGSTSSLNFATTGTLGGAIAILDNVASPSAAQMYGSLNIVNAAITVTLPAAASGMSICVLSVAAAAVNVDVDASDVIYLNGTALSAGDKVTSASAAGDFICLVAGDATNWYTLGRSGTWTDGN